MAAYEPIRDSFREFNRMLTDKQSWDAKHEASLADRSLKETMLLNQLDQQQFNNDIAQKSMNLRVKGHELAADRLDEQIRNNNRNYNLNVDTLDSANLRHKQTINAENTRFAKKHNLNVEKFLADENQINVTNAAKAKVDQANINSLNALTKQRKQQNRVLKDEADKSEIELEPVATQIPEYILNNDEAMEVIKDEMFTRNGGTIDENGVPVDASGNPMELPQYKWDEMKTKADALTVLYDNKPKRVQQELISISNQKASLEKSIKDKDSSYDHIQRATMKRQVKMLEGETGRRKNFLQRVNSPQYLRKQASDLRKRAAVVSARGGSNGPEVAKMFLEEADALDKRAEQTVEALIESNKPTKKSSDNTLFKRSEELLVKDLLGDKTMMDTFTKAESMLASTARRKFSEALQQKIKEGKTPKNEGDTNALRKDVKDTLMREHNEFVIAFKQLVIQDKIDVNDYEEMQKLRLKLAPILRDAGFDYIPMEDFMIQFGDN